MKNIHLTFFVLAILPISSILVSGDKDEKEKKDTHKPSTSMTRKPQKNTFKPLESFAKNLQWKQLRQGKTSSSDSASLQKLPS